MTRICAIFLTDNTNTSIVRTIYYNINKLKRTNSLKHRGGHSRSCVLSGIGEKAVGQYIQRNNEIKENLSTRYDSSVSISTIRRHLHEYVYKNVLPKSTHMLTTHDKKRRVQWAKQHQPHREYLVDRKTQS